MASPIDMNRRHKYELARAQMEYQRSSFISTWRDNAEYILPRRTRFFTSDTNKGDLRNQKIIDSTATLAARSGRAGMMGGITSPARPWMKLSIPNFDISETSPAKLWLDNQTKKILNIFLKSNLYTVLPIIYGDLMVFGTACMLMERDNDRVIRFFPMPIGSFMIGQNSQLKVDRFAREYRMTVWQIVEKFGMDSETKKINWENISDSVKSQFENQQYEDWVDICHVIIPNEEYDPKKSGQRFKKYTSVYYEKGSTGGGGSMQSFFGGGIDQGKFLRKSGFDYFPVLAPRWEVTGEDVYGVDCPGNATIGDIKQLQTGEKRIAQAVEKMINPPLIGPSALRSQSVSLLPGDVTYLDTREASNGLRPVHEVNFRVDIMEQKQEQIRQRIRKGFYEDLFLQLSNLDRRQITAREIEERHEEKLLALGPVLEQLNQDLLDPLVENTFIIASQNGLIEEPPEEIAGRELRIEYTSIMAEAQKLAGLGGVERFAGFAGQMASIDPSALDKLNTDQILDVYGDLTSVPASIIRSDEEVAQIRQQRQQAQQAQQQMEQLAQGVGAAKTLSETSLEGSNALTEIAGGGL